MAKDIGKRIGEKFAEFRRVAGMTQEQLSEKVRVTPGTISRLERGVTIPSIRTLAKLAAALGLGLRDLFDFRGQTSAKEAALDSLVQELRQRSVAEIQMVRDLAKRVFQETN